MAIERKKPRAQRTRRAVAAGSVVAMLSLGGAMAWADAHRSSGTSSQTASSNASSSSSGSSSSYRDDDSATSGSADSGAGTSSTSRSTSSYIPHTRTGGS